MTNPFKPSLTARFTAEGRISKNPGRRRSASDEPPASRTHISGVDHAIDVTEKIMSGVKTDFSLVSSPEFRSSHPKNHASIYSDYHFLCYLNTRMCTGYVVCNYVIEKSCDACVGVRKWRSGTGTTDLINHQKKHVKGAVFDLVKVDNCFKKQLADSAAVASVRCLLPFTFAEGKGMEQFQKTLVSIGQKFPANAKLDFTNVFPSAEAVRSGIRRLAESEREKFKKEVHDIMKIGGGVTTDGLTHTGTGNHYYDFIVHYYSLSTSTLLERPRGTLRSRIIFLKCHNGAADAATLRCMLDNALTETIGVSLHSFMSQMTLVTDSASVMPNLVGATTSERVEMDERWLPCISHRLNIVMRHVMDALVEEKSRVGMDFEAVKTVVRICKKSGWNSSLPIGKRLIQAVETRFGTHVDVTKRFILSITDVTVLATSAATGKRPNTNAKKELDSILREHTQFGVRYPALEAIVECFSPIRDMQKAMEAAKHPIMHHVLPRLMDLKRRLRLISSGVPRSMSGPHPHVCLIDMAARTIIELEKVRIHDLWIAACVLHPGLYDLPFADATCNVGEMKTRGYDLIRKLIRDCHGENVSGGETDVGDGALISFPSNEFNLRQSMSFVATGNKRDELEKFISEGISTNDIRELKERDDIASFWITRIPQYPQLSKVALRVFATPPSSASSERDFSVVNRLITEERSRLDPSIVEDIIFLHSVMQDKGE